MSIQNPGAEKLKTGNLEHLQCSQYLVRVRFSKNAGIMRVHFLLKCGCYAGIKSQKCGYITVKMRVLCRYFKRSDTFSSLPRYTKMLSFHSIYRLALPCLVKKDLQKFKIFFTNILNYQHIMFFWNLSLSATLSNRSKNANISQIIII